MVCTDTGDQKPAQQLNNLLDHLFEWPESMPTAMAPTPELLSQLHKARHRKRNREYAARSRAKRKREGQSQSQEWRSVML